MNDIFQPLQYIVDAIKNLYHTIFDGVDFTVLYSWLPNDFRVAIGGIIVVLIILAIARAIKSVLPF